MSIWTFLALGKMQVARRFTKTAFDIPACHVTEPNRLEQQVGNYPSSNLDEFTHPHQQKQKLTKTQCKPTQQQKSLFSSSLPSPSSSFCHVSTVYLDSTVKTQTVLAMDIIIHHLSTSANAMTDTVEMIAPLSIAMEYGRMTILLCVLVMEIVHYEIHVFVMMDTVDIIAPLSNVFQYGRMNLPWCVLVTVNATHPTIVVVTLDIMDRIVPLSIAMAPCQTILLYVLVMDGAANIIIAHAIQNLKVMIALM